jgi:hypothetical protein
MFKVKFEKFLDYLQGSLNFSTYMRDEIGRLSVGECAVNMALTTSVPYPSTFLVQRVEGEEPTKEYFLDMANVLTEKQRRDVSVARSVSFLKEDFRRKLRQYGITDEKIEELTKAFDKSNRRMDIIAFVITLERLGVARRNISDFLKDSGIDDATIINIFAKVDLKKGGAGSGQITQVTLEE